MMECIRALGHGNIKAKHGKTLMVTKERHLTPRGDCIVAVGADKACADLSREFKEKIRRSNAEVEVTIECGGIKERVLAYGHPNLLITHPHDIVIRKSDFICGRTLAIKADKAACDLERKLVECIRNGGEVLIKLKVH